MVKFFSKWKQFLLSLSLVLILFWNLWGTAFIQNIEDPSQTLEELSQFLQANASAPLTPRVSLSGTSSERFHFPTEGFYFLLHSSPQRALADAHIQPELLKTSEFHHSLRKHLYLRILII